MGGRALRMAVLKSAGNFTRDVCHDLNAEKIQRVKYFMFTRCGIVACQQFSNAGAAGRVRKFQVVVNLAEVAVYFAVSGLPIEADTNRKGRHVRWGRNRRPIDCSQRSRCRPDTSGPEMAAARQKANITKMRGVRQRTDLRANAAGD